MPHKNDDGLFLPENQITFRFASRFVTSLNLLRLYCKVPSKYCSAFKLTYIPILLNRFIFPTKV